MITLQRKESPPVVSLFNKFFLVLKIFVRENYIFIIDGVMDILREVNQDMKGFENGMCSNIAPQ